MQFPAQFADIIDPQQPDTRHAGYLSLFAGKPAKGLIGQISTGALSQDRARLRPGQNQRAISIGHIDDLDVFAIKLAPGKLVKIVQLRRGCRQDVEQAGGQAGHRDLALDETIGIEQMGENNAAILHRDFVGANSFQKRKGVRPAHLELGEGGKVHQADALAHRQCLAPHRLPPV